MFCVWLQQNLHLKQVFLDPIKHFEHTFTLTFR